MCIRDRLTHIAKLENVQVDADAMQLIARTAQGSMRDAVGLLDQLVPLAMSQTGGTPPGETSGKQSSPDAPPLPISLESARSLLGIADPRLLDSLLDDVLAGRAAREDVIQQRVQQSRIGNAEQRSCRLEADRQGGCVRRTLLA